MYDSDTNSVTSALKASSTAVFSDATISQILALTSTSGDPAIKIDTGVISGNGTVSFAAGTELGFVNLTAPNTQITITGDTSTIILGGNGSANLVVGNPNDTVVSGGQAPVNQFMDGPVTNAGSAAVQANGEPVPDRVVVGSAGNDNIKVVDSKDTKIILGTGSSTVTTGNGIDTVEAGLGNSTVIGGKGDYAVVKLAGNSSNYVVTESAGHAVVKNTTTNKTTDITGVQLVQLDNGESLVFAKDVKQGQAGLLYQVAFGRDADVAGMDFWFDKLSSGATIKQIATGFVNSAEFAAAHANQSDEQFVQSLYQNAFGRDAEDAGLAFWTNALAHGSTKADLIASFSEVAINNVAGTMNTEVQVIGNVTIVTGII